MAEGFLRDSIASDDELAGNYFSASAGLSAFDGDAASTNAVTVLKNKWNIDIACHSARRINLNDIKTAYLILTMTKNHKDAILSVYPQYIDKVFTLKEFAEDSMDEENNRSTIHDIDIVDPYGMSLETYERCADEIKSAVDKLVIMLKKADNTFTIP
jgi:protein-tyrosine phosphatase